MARKKTKRVDYEVVPPACPKMSVLQSAVKRLMQALPKTKERHTVDPVIEGVDWSRVASIVNGGEHFALAYFMALDLSKSERTL